MHGRHFSDFERGTCGDIGAASLRACGEHAALGRGAGADGGALGLRAGDRARDLIHGAGEGIGVAVPRMGDRVRNSEHGAGGGTGAVVPRVGDRARERVEHRREPEPCRERGGVARLLAGVSAAEDSPEEGARREREAGACGDHAHTTL